MDKRVVIADDESIIRLDLKEILEDDGYLVVGEAARGDDALVMIKEHQPDLALLDIKMPGLDGIEVARALKGSSTVVVLLTLPSPVRLPTRRPWLTRFPVALRAISAPRSRRFSNASAAISTPSTACCSARPRSS